MKLVALTLDDDELPKNVVVSMPVREAAMLARVLGATSPAARNEVFPGWGEVGDEVYECLAGLFNRFYEGGVGEYFRG